MKGNDFLQYNRLIFSVYETAEFARMKTWVLEALCTLMPCTCGSFLMSEPDRMGFRMTEPVCVPAAYAGVEERYLTLADSDFGKWTFSEPEIMVLRATDMLADEERMNHILYQECFVPFGLQYAVYVNLVYKEVPLGLLSLYRETALGDFSEDNVFLLKALARHLSLRFHWEKNQCGPRHQRAETNTTALEFAARQGLTNRELEVFLALTPQLSDHALAQTLCISEYTLKKHIQNLYSKTGTKRRLTLIQLRDSVL